jgi:hypothetical protein
MREDPAPIAPAQEVAMGVMVAGAGLSDEKVWAVNEDIKYPTPASDSKCTVTEIYWGLLNSKEDMLPVGALPPVPELAPVSRAEYNTQADDVRRRANSVPSGESTRCGSDCESIGSVDSDVRRNTRAISTRIVDLPGFGNLNCFYSSEDGALNLITEDDLGRIQNVAHKHNSILVGDSVRRCLHNDAVTGDCVTGLRQLRGTREIHSIVWTSPEHRKRTFTTIEYALTMSCIQRSEYTHALDTLCKTKPTVFESELSSILNKPNLGKRMKRQAQSYLDKLTPTSSASDSQHTLQQPDELAAAQQYLAAVEEARSERAGLQLPTHNGDVPSRITNHPVRPMH